MLYYLIAQANLLKARADRLRKDEAGLGTLETVIIALGLFLLASAAVAVIGNAVTSRTDQIN